VVYPSRNLSKGSRIVGAENSNRRSVPLPNIYAMLLCGGISATLRSCSQTPFRAVPPIRRGALARTARTYRRLRSADMGGSMRISGKRYLEATSASASTEKRQVDEGEIPGLVDSVW
jgi:hypothetical protein